MDLVITILGWIALGVISAYLLAIIGKIIFDAATADYKLYKHVRLCRKRLLRQRYEDYAWLLFQLEKDTEVFNLTHNTRDWLLKIGENFILKKQIRISNDYKNSLCIDRLKCIRLFAIDAEKCLVAQILALHYSATKKSILVTTLIGK